ncbi:MAG: hypothetical protein WDM92_13695 [Caulobacteraceae bacterium]
MTQANPALTNTTEGYSAFGSFKFNSQFGVFGRYDWVKPRRDTSPNMNDNYFNVGISYSPAKIVDFALVYKRDKIDSGAWGTSNGVIGMRHRAGRLRRQRHLRRSRPVHPAALVIGRLVA